MTDFKNNVQKTQQDKRLLRYLITDADIVHSTAAPDPLGCHYIYVKPGWYNSVTKISNIDFAKFVYAENGINLKKHISKIDGKETEVLFIGITEEYNLPSASQEFLENTAPFYIDAKTRERDTELCNKIFKIQKDIPTNTGR